MYSAAADRYQQMQYRRCGKSGILLPALSLGLWQNFGYENNFENIKTMICSAFDQGIVHFDLANNYGRIPGSAEENFGKLINGDLKSYRDEILISTKAGYYMWPGPYGEWGSRKSLIASIDQSLKRLNLDYVDIFYHHRPDVNTPLEETMEALKDIVQTGKALYIGLSNYSLEQTKEAMKILDGMGVHCLIHQLKYSMLERGSRLILEEVKRAGGGFIAYSPLAQGILTGKYIEGIPDDSRAAGPSIFLSRNHITEDIAKVTKELTEIARKRGQTLAQMALSWLLYQDGVSSVLIGASKTVQISENINALNNLYFTDRELEDIEQVLFA